MIKIDAADMSATRVRDKSKLKSIKHKLNGYLTCSKCGGMMIITNKQELKRIISYEDIYTDKYGNVYFDKAKMKIIDKYDYQWLEMKAICSRFDRGCNHSEIIDVQFKEWW